MLAVRAPTREEEQIKAEPNTQRGPSRLTSACSQAGGSSPGWKIKGFFIRDKCLAIIFMLARVSKKKQKKKRSPSTAAAAEQLAYFPGNFYIMLLLSLMDYLLGGLSSHTAFPW